MSKERLLRDRPAGRLTNWLPAPAGKFSLYIRAYWADKEITVHHEDCDALGHKPASVSFLCQQH
jgi:hypothetical protein